MRGRIVESRRVLILVVLVCALSSASLGAPWLGSGDANDPYQIWTAEDMQAIGADANYWGAHFELKADIDLGDYTETSFNIIGTDPYYGGVAFTGVFDGNGNKIYNFTYRSSSTRYIGIFGWIEGEDAEIRDLGLVDPNVDGGTGRFVGALVGRSGGDFDGGTLRSCYVEGGQVSGYDYVGGLAGSNSGEMYDCSSSASVFGDTSVGGLVGSSYYSHVYYCSSTGDVSGDEEVGGLLGTNGGTVFNSYSSADVWGFIEVGGLVGDSRGLEAVISDSYARGSVLGYDAVGGLLGRAEEGTGISNCYASGRVEGRTEVGGFVGRGYNSHYSSCFWDNDVNPDLNGIGNAIDPNVKGESTANMQMAGTFTSAGWDFVGELENGPSDLWAEPNIVDYPVLWWQLEPLPDLPSFSGGTGEVDNPYLISTATELNRIGCNPRLMGRHFKLLNDIDLTDVEFFTIGNEICWFHGSFDGDGNVVSGFSHSSSGLNGVGFFGCVKGEDAHITRLGLEEPNVSGGTGRCVGGLVGLLKEGSISNCYTEGGSVSGGESVGGLVGVIYYLAVGLTECYSSASVTGMWDNVGGLTGINGSAVSSCYSSGDVSGESYVGGLVGHNGSSAVIRNCYSTGSVSATEWHAGGLVGYNWGEIFDCYSTGSVSGGESTVGGLVGSAWGTVFDSFWDVNSSGMDTSDGGTGLPTAEMQMGSTFTDAGWDFVGEVINGANDIWQICEGEDYPRFAWEKYGGGNGTEASPYLIYTSCQMNAIGANRDDWDKHFKLMADIDLSAYTGTSFNIIGERYLGGPVGGGTPFTGVFDGDGHTISNFSYTSTWKSGVGLFGYVDGGPAGVSNAPNAVIQDLGLVDPNIQSGGDYVGGLVGGILGGTVKDCYVQGGRISGRSYVGGLLGGAQWSLMAVNRVIARCYSSASVSGEGKVGGLVGAHFFYEISNSYSRGDVVGEERVGGLVGMNWSGTISDCYSAGSVSGTMEVGGLVGYDGSGVYIKSFCDSDVNPDVNGIGNGEDPNVIGKTTVEMQVESTFTDSDWDFVDESDNGIRDIWRLCNEGTEYPQLNWQYPAGDFVCPDGVDWIDVGVLCEEWLLGELSCDVWPEGGDGFVNFLDWGIFADGWGVTYDYDDLAEFAGQWLKSGSNYLITDIAGGSDGDGITNGVDFAVLADNWLRGM